MLSFIHSFIHSFICSSQNTSPPALATAYPALWTFNIHSSGACTETSGLGDLSAQLRILSVWYERVKHYSFSFSDSEIAMKYIKFSFSQCMDVSVWEWVNNTSSIVDLTTRSADLPPIHMVTRSRTMTLWHSIGTWPRSFRWAAPMVWDALRPCSMPPKPEPLKGVFQTIVEASSRH